MRTPDEWQASRLFGRTARQKFKYGDRVVLTQKGIDAGLHGRLPLPCYGTVGGFGRNDWLVRVHRIGGARGKETYHMDFWEVV